VARASAWRHLSLVQHAGWCAAVRALPPITPGDGGL